MIFYKCTYLKSPKYLKEFLTYRIESRTSRSSNSKILRYHKFRLVRYVKISVRYSTAVGITIVPTMEWSTSRSKNCEIHRTFQK